MKKMMHNQTEPKNTLRRICLLAAVVLMAPVWTLAGADEAEMRQRVAELERQLAVARAELREAQVRAMEVETALAEAPAAAPGKIEVGPFQIGGAIRANYVLGDYPGRGGGPSRGGHGGNFELDTFRINVNFSDGPYVGALEYRWYNGYNFLHTGWIGYNFEDGSQVQVGVNRVPFGPGPFGNSASWFFDQHYYVGLADDMDLGIKYTTTIENVTLDFAYYIASEGSWRGTSRDSARYSYDVVRWNIAVNPDGTVDFGAPTNGFRESHQLNARAIMSLEELHVPSEIGASLQYGRLKGVETDSGDLFAGSVHMRNFFNGFTLGTQLTYYKYDISADNPWGTDELVPMGAYDFAWPVAARAWIPSVSLRYFHETANIPWLDSVTPYVEYSTVMKRADGFNDSALLILGAAWARGGWFIYTDFAYSNGNYFVGDDGDDYSRVDGVGDFGVNGNDKWNKRLNINFGYYF